MLMERSIFRYLTIVFGLVALLMSINIGVLEYIGLASDSIKLPRKMAQAQIESPLSLVLPGDLRYWAAYKLPLIAEQKPEIVLVGSSRAGQMRSAMFKPYKFYNASFTAWSVKQVVEMVDQITRVSKPRVIIVALDHFMFTDAYEKSVAVQRSMYFNNDWRFRYDSFFNFIKLLTQRPSLYWDYIYPRLHGRETAGVDGLKLIGIDAMAAQSGFRIDGSFLYSAGLIAAAPERTKQNKGLIESVPGGANIDANQLSELERLTALAKERGVQLVGVQLPYLKASVDYMNNDPGYQPYAGVWREFESDKMRGKLRDLGIPFFDLCCISLNADSTQFIDAIHLGERGMIQSLLELLRDAQFHSLFPAMNSETLESDLAAAQKSGKIFDIYHNQF